MRAQELGGPNAFGGLISDTATLQFALSTNPDGTFRADVTMTEESFVWRASDTDTCAWTLAAPASWPDEHVYIGEIDGHLWLDPDDTFGIPGPITWNEDCTDGQHNVHTQSGYDFGWPLYACPVKFDNTGTYEADAGPIVKSSPTSGTVSAVTSRSCLREDSSLTQTVTSNLAGLFPEPPPTPTPTVTPTSAPSPTPTSTATATASPPPPPAAFSFPNGMKVKGSLTVGSTLKLKNYGVVAGRLPGPAYKFQWYAGTAKIAHATKNRLLLKAELVGKRIAVEVRAITPHEKLAKKIVAGKVKG